MMVAGRSIRPREQTQRAVSDKTTKKAESPQVPFSIWLTQQSLATPPPRLVYMTHDDKSPRAHLVGEAKHLRTLWQSVRRSRVLPSVITTSTQSIKNMQFVFNSLPLDPKYFSIQEKTFQRHFSRVNANIVTTLAWIPSGRCMDLYLCKGRVGELATHKRYWFRNCLP